MKAKLTVFWVALVAVLMLLVGCGGGGGSTPTSGTSNMAVFVTDNLNANYDHVWVTIYKIELRTNGSASTTVFDDTAGTQVDLRALNDGASLYQLLGVANVTGGSFGRAEVTMDKDLVLFPSGATTGTTYQFADSLDSGAGQVKLNAVFSSPMSINGNSRFVLDFDLSQWDIVNGQVVPLVKLGNGNGINNENRHHESSLHGSIASLSGTVPDLTFNLVQGNRQVTVQTDASTSVYREDGNGDSSLANGQRVEVEGIFDVTTHTYQASSIKIESNISHDDADKVKGTVVDGSVLADSFQVTATEVEGFLPGADAITVNLNSSTKFFGPSGRPVSQADFIAALSSGSEVTAYGTADTAGTVITAKKVRLKHEHGEDSAHARGVVVSADSGSESFVITVGSWYGFTFTEGDNLNVVASSSTQYLSESGVAMSKADFFAALVAGKGVEVEGSYDGAKLTATKAKLQGTQGGDDEDEVLGLVTSSDVGTRTITVNLIQWAGFDSTAGSSLTITMDANSTYRFHGAVVTEQDFFSALANFPVVEVDGTKTTSGFDGVKAHVED